MFARQCLSIRPSWRARITFSNGCQLTLMKTLKRWSNGMEIGRELRLQTPIWILKNGNWIVTQQQQVNVWLVKFWKKDWLLLASSYHYSHLSLEADGKQLISIFSPYNLSTCYKVGFCGCSLHHHHEVSSLAIIIILILYKWILYCYHVPPDWTSTIWTHQVERRCFHLSFCDNFPLRGSRIDALR